MSDYLQLILEYLKNEMSDYRYLMVLSTGLIIIKVSDEDDFDETFKLVSEKVFNATAKLKHREYELRFTLWNNKHHRSLRIAK